MTLFSTSAILVLQPKKGGVNMIVKNTRVYVDASPTNLRLKRELKDILIAEAKKQNTTLSALINDLIRKTYVKKEA